MSQGYKSFPFLGTYYFWKQIPPSGKRIFWIGFIVFCISGLLAISVSFLPFDVLIPYESLAEHAIENISLKKSEDGFPIYMFAPSFYNFQVFVAYPIKVSMLWVLAYLLVSAVGWSLLLAASSKINGWYGYLIYFGIGALWVFSEAGEMMFSEDPSHIYSFAVVMVFIGLAYHYKNQENQPPLIHQFWRFLVLFAIVFAWAGLYRGENELRHFAYYSYPVHLFLLLVFIIFVSKEISFGIILWASNRREPSQRYSAEVIYGLMTLLTLVNLYWVLGLYFGFDLPKIFSPVVLLVLSGVVSVLASQSIFAMIQSYVTNYLVFLVLVLGVGSIAMGFVSFIGLNGEALLLLQIERWAAFFMTGFSFATLLYTFFNFHGLLKYRTNLFFVFSTPNTLSYKALFLAILAGLVVTEGHHKWRSINISMSGYFDHLADYQLVLGNDTTASQLYINARLAAVANPKSNFNFGCLNHNNPEEKIDALRLYSEATAVIPFHAPDLNIGFYQSTPKQSINYYLSLPHKSDKIFHNLGYFYYKLNELDSAAYYWKQALQQNPNLSEAFSNLAIVYYLHGKKEWAKKMAAFIQQKGLPHNQENLLFLSLALDTNFIALRDLVADSLYTLNYNQAIIHLKYNEPQRTYDLVRSLEKQFNEEYLPFVYLKMFAQLWQGELVAGQDKARYISEYFPSYQKQAWHSLAGFYYFHGMPELAIDPFLETKDHVDTLNAYFMQLLAGHHDMALQKLNTIRAEYKEFLELIRHETALVYQAYGLEEAALPDWDFTGITFAEALRGAHYATQADQLKQAEFFFSKARAIKPHHPELYKQLILTFLHFDDKRAMQACDSALFFFPNDPAILALNAYTAAIYKKPTEQLLNKLEDNSPFVQLYKAKTLFILKKFDDAIKVLNSVLERFPYHDEANILLADIYKAQGKAEENDVLSKALVKNEKNYKLWHRYFKYQKEHQYVEELKTAYEHLKMYAPTILFQHIREEYNDFMEANEPHDTTE